MLTTQGCHKSNSGQTLAQGEPCAGEAAAEVQRCVRYLISDKEATRVVDSFTDLVPDTAFGQYHAGKSFNTLDLQEQRYVHQMDPERHLWGKG